MFRPILAGPGGNDGGFGNVDSLQGNSNQGFNTSNVKQVWGQQPASAPAPSSYNSNSFNEPPAPPADVSSAPPDADTWNSGAAAGGESRWGTPNNQPDYPAEGKKATINCVGSAFMAFCPQLRVR